MATAVEMAGDRLHSGIGATGVGHSRPSKEQLEMGKVFVGGLSRETTTNGLRDYFERFGDISDCVVMKDRSTGAPRGFGFVTYASQLIADRVVLHRHVIDGKEVEAKPAVPRDSESLSARGAVTPPVVTTPCGGTQVPLTTASGATAPGLPPPLQSTSTPAQQTGDFPSKKIFVGGLSHDTSEQSFVAYFSNFGQVVDCVIMCDPHTRKPRGFGFITYDSDKAVERVCNHKFHDLNGKRVEVKRAIPQERIAAEEGGAAAASEVAALNFPSGRRPSGNSSTNAVFPQTSFAAAAAGATSMGVVPGLSTTSLNASSMPLNNLPVASPANMFPGMVGVTNSLNQNAWNMPMLPPTMLPNVLHGDAPVTTGPDPMLAIPSEAPSIAQMNGVAPALALEGTVDTMADSVALNEQLLKVLSNQLNYGSATPGLSTGTRPGHGHEERHSNSLGSNEHEFQTDTQHQEAASLPVSLLHDPLAPVSRASLMAPGAPLQPTAIHSQHSSDLANPSVLMTGQIQQQLQALQQQQQLLNQLQQQQIQLQIQQHKQQQQLQMHLHIQQQSGIAADGSVTGVDTPCNDLTHQLMQLGITDVNQMASSVNAQDLQQLSSFQMQGYSQLQRLL